MAFCLIPKILNSIYVVMIFSKMRAVIEAKIAKFTHIITTEGTRVHYAIRLNFSRITNSLAVLAVTPSLNTSMSLFYLC